MRKGNRIGIQLGVLLLAFSILGCQKPKLRADKSQESEEKVISKESGKSYEELRKSVIGKTFAALTLGSRKFVNAEVREITDEAITIRHGGGVDIVPWTEVPVEVREQWGYNPLAASLAAKSTVDAPEPDVSSGKDSMGTTEPIENLVIQKPKANSRERAMEIARRQKELEAQLAGIRNLESDLARHSQTLNTLRRQQQSLRALQSGQRSGGVRVERVNGKSTMVDRRGQLKEVENKLKAEEQIVAQFSKSLQAARQKYQSMRMAVDQLLRE